jgi:peptidoglycan/xylan/chitin deacetylase (PgdA/CDA1 family)
LRLLALSLATGGLMSCVGEVVDDDQAPQDFGTLEQAAITSPEVDFASRPSYIATNTVVLTFDDGPDNTNTPRVLDILRANNLKATFFVNTINFTDVNTDATARALVQRMVNEGHELGSHTVHHLNLGTLTSAMIESEIAGVENTVRPLIGGRRLSLLRAPFGIPYNPNDDTSQIAKVAPVVGNHAVHIGWHISAEDAGSCAGNTTCIVNQVKNALSAGSYGVILFHCTSAATANGLQQIIDFVRSRGMVFRSTEDVVRGRFGVTTASAEVVDNQFSHVNRSPTADASVRDGSFANTNFGSATGLEVKTATSGFNRDAYLKYDISGLATISRAKLRVFAGLSEAATNSVAVHSVATTTWTESAITWNNRPARSGSALSSVVVGGTSLGGYDLDVTSYVQSQKAAGKTVVSFALHAPNVSVAVTTASARESANSRPQLVITP